MGQCTSDDSVMRLVVVPVPGDLGSLGDSQLKEADMAAEGNLSHDLFGLGIL